MKMDLRTCKFLLQLLFLCLVNGHRSNSLQAELPLSGNDKGWQNVGTEQPTSLDGNRKFQFYIASASGSLEKRWLTLEEVQDMLLSPSVFKSQSNFGDLNTASSNSQFHSTKPEFLKPHNFQKIENRPGGKVEDILANIHKVVSDELTTPTEQQFTTQEFDTSTIYSSIEPEPTMIQTSSLVSNNSPDLEFPHMKDDTNKPKDSSSNSFDDGFPTEIMLAAESTTENIDTKAPITETLLPVTENWVFTPDLSPKVGLHSYSLIPAIYSPTFEKVNTEELHPKNSLLPIADQAHGTEEQANTAPGDLHSKQRHNSNVLQSDEISNLSKSHINTLGNLEKKEADATDDFYDTPVYLEDLPEVNYDYSPNESSNIKNESEGILDLQFPGPDVAISYFQPDHISQVQVPGSSNPKLPEENLDPVDPTQFLPAFNPEIAKGENPLRPTPYGNLGLEITTKSLGKDMKLFIDTINNISFEVYKKTAKKHRRQNMVMCPLNLISALSIARLGARNTTADLLSQLLRDDDFRSFNLHLMLKNITKKALAWNSYTNQIAFSNNVYLEKDLKPYDLGLFGRTLSFFYNSKVEEVDKLSVGALARDIANADVRKQTRQQVNNFLKPTANLVVEGPIGIVSGAYFQGKWKAPLHEQNLFDMNFIRFPSAERRLIKTVGIRNKMSVRAGYDPYNDATIAEVPLDSAHDEFSLVLVMPGRQKNFIANGLSQLEQKLNSEIWGQLIRKVIPHTLTFEMPVFSHRNYLNISSTIAALGLQELFQENADFSGINGAKNLYIGDVVQLNEFHSIKLSLLRRKRDLTKSSVDDQRPPFWQYFERKNRMEGPVLAYDRAFFYTLRHNPTGLILFIGRYLDPETF